MATLFSYGLNDTNSFPSAEVEWFDVIKSQSMGSRAANSNNFSRETFIYSTPVMKSHQVSNEVSRALCVGCVCEYGKSMCAFLCVCFGECVC